MASRYFIVDEKGSRAAIVIPIDEYERLLEEVEDLAIIAERKNEPVDTFENDRKRLESRNRNLLEAP